MKCQILFFFGKKQNKENISDCHLLKSTRMLRANAAGSSEQTLIPHLKEGFLGNVMNIGLAVSEKSFKNFIHIYCPGAGADDPLGIKC